MKASELIERLQKIIEKEGDLICVECYHYADISSLDIEKIGKELIIVIGGSGYEE